MFQESYDAQELGYRLFADAQAVDRKKLTAFCEHYENELTGFARELLRGLQIGI
jgi:hypothetical protein